MSERSAEEALEAIAVEDQSDSHGYCTPAYVAICQVNGRSVNGADASLPDRTKFDPRPFDR